MQKSKKITLVLLGVSVLLVLLAFTFNKNGNSSDHSVERLYLVQKYQLSKNISLIANLEPERHISVKAPFEGVLLEKNIAIERPVKKGELLMRFDSKKIAIDTRKTAVELKKLKNKLYQLQNWDSSVEVQLVEKKLIQAKKAYQAAQKKFNQTTELFELGIVSRRTLEDEQSQLNDKRTSIISSKNDLNKTMLKGSELEIEGLMVEIDEKEQALEKLRQLESQATIKAFEDGVVIRSQKEGGKSVVNGLSSRVGEVVKKGQTLFTLATIKNLAVKARVSETDIHNIHLGKEVKLFSGVFPEVQIMGKIIQVANSATVDFESNSQEQSFEFKVLIENIPSEYREKMKLGTTINLEIQVGSASDEIVVPLDAILQDSEGTFVMLSNENGSSKTRQAVTLGEYTDAGVEILSGLEVDSYISIPNLSASNYSNPFPAQGGFGSNPDIR